MVAQTQKNKEMKNLKKDLERINIPSNFLALIKGNYEDVRCTMRVLTNGVISLTGFAIVQFLEGADIVNNSHPTMDQKDVSLLLKLAKSIGILNDFDTIEFDITYGELKVLRSWLEARMLHCEKERDDRTMMNLGGVEYPKFNPDTYIGQKLLLLDLRELMLGQII